MASLQGVVRTNLAVRHGDVARFMTELNESYFKLTAANRYATLFFALVDVSGPTLYYVNAGHIPPMLFRNAPSSPDRAGPVEKLESGGPPVGTLAEANTGRSTSPSMTETFWSSSRMELPTH